MAGLVFGVCMGITFGLLYEASRGILAGVLGGILFALLIAAFVASQAKRFTTNRPLNADENLVKEGGANHFLNHESVGGWIYLTDKRFYFKSHDQNIQNHEFIVPLAEIESVERKNNLGIIPNGMKLILKDQTTERFVINGAGDWVKAITGLIKN
jgi:hypothetical protein